MGFAKKSKNNTAINEGTKKNQKSVKGLAKSVQDVLDFEGITQNGIIIGKGGFYSKLYKLIDSNFVTEPDDKQWEVLSEYTKFVNRFPDNIDINIVIVNKRNTMGELVSNFHLAEQGDKLDNYRREYNAIIDQKITEGRNDISKEKFIMLTAKERSLPEAETTFNSVDISLNEAIKAINKVGVTPITALERLKIIREILNGAMPLAFEKEYDRYIEKMDDGEGNITLSLDVEALSQAGVSVKDLVAPQVIARGKQHIMLNENRFAKSFAYANLPQQLDTSFLTKTTNLPFEMVTVIQLNTVPRKKAINLVKMQNTSIKADVIKASQTAYKNGYSPDLMDEDLLKAQQEAKQLRADVVNEGKKLFYATMVVTIFGESEEELKSINEQYSAICADFTVTPSYLIGQQVQALNTACLLTRSKIIIDRLLTSDNVCALFPFNIQELQDKRGHFYGINSISKNMIMYDRKRSKLANGLIFGQSGSGKSFLTKGEIIPNLLHGNDDMIILDPENEYRIIADAFGGVVIDLELKSDYCINPCDMSMEWDDPKATPLAEKCDYMVGLVESILGRGRECNSFEVNAIHKATTKMYEPYIDEMTRRKNDGIVMDIDTSITPTLVDFFNCLVEQKTTEAAKVANAIEPYCVGQYNVFAHHTNVPTGNRLTVFNLLSLPEKMKEMAMKVCLANIWTRVVKNRENNEKNGTGKSIWVYLDEFHLFFQTEASATTIMAYFKRVRKYGGIMTGITQDVADLLRTQQGTAMFNNSGFFIFLNQSPIGRNQLQQLYGISDTLIEYIKDKPSGQGLIYNGSILIPFDYRLPTDNALYRLMSTNPNDRMRKKTDEDNIADDLSTDNDARVSLTK
jgi:type IV secretory pathway VirB4 component